MRYGIFSDVHANLEALEAVLAAYDQEHLDARLFAGDIVGYGADPGACLAIMQDIVSEAVAGNHDYGCVELFDIEDFNPFAKEAILWTRQQLSQEQGDFLKALPLVYEARRFTIVHGSLHMPENFYYIMDEESARESLELQVAPVCFIGHTHESGAYIESSDGSITYSRAGEIAIEPDKKYLINVGSVGQPRDGDPRASFCVYDTDENRVFLKRVTYNIKEAQAKIIHAGLPLFLAQRLAAGR